MFIWRLHPFFFCLLFLTGLPTLLLCHPLIWDFHPDSNSASPLTCGPDISGWIANFYHPKPVSESGGGRPLQLLPWVTAEVHTGGVVGGAEVPNEGEGGGRRSNMGLPCVYLAIVILFRSLFLLLVFLFLLFCCFDCSCFACLLLCCSNCFTAGIGMQAGGRFVFVLDFFCFCFCLKIVLRRWIVFISAMHFQSIFVFAICVSIAFVGSDDWSLSDVFLCCFVDAFFELLLQPKGMPLQTRWAACTVAKIVPSCGLCKWMETLACPPFMTSIGGRSTRKP